MKTLDRAVREYMSEMGRKGGKIQGAANKLKGSEYFSRISSVKKPRKK